MRKMHHGQNRGKQKSKLSKTREFNENRVKFLIFDETGRKFINFVQRGEITICIIDLRGMDASGSWHDKNKFQEVCLADRFKMLY